MILNQNQKETSLFAHYLQSIEWDSGQDYLEAEYGLKQNGANSYKVLHPNHDTLTFYPNTGFIIHFATGERYYLNQFLEEFEGMDNASALKAVCMFYNVDIEQPLTTKELKDLQEKAEERKEKRILHKKKEATNAKVLHKVDFKDARFNWWSENDRKYWNARKISTETLDKYYIKPLRGFVQENLETGKVWRKDNLEGKYAYNISYSAQGDIVGMHVKDADGYNPLLKNSKDIQLGNKPTTLLGETELIPQMPVCIVYGIADFLSVNEHLPSSLQGKIQFVDAKAEHTKLPQLLTDKLQALGIKKVIVAPDSDYRGRQLAQQLPKNHEVTVLNIPKLRKQFFTQRKGKYVDLNGQELDVWNGKVQIGNQEFPIEEGCKPKNNDLNDYIVSYGFDKELENAFWDALSPVIEVNSRTSNTLYNYLQNIKKDLIPTENGYLTHTEIDLVETTLLRKKELILQSGTGSRKTSTVLGDLAQRFAKKSIYTLFAVTSKEQAEQLAKDIQNKPYYADIKAITQVHTDAQFGIENSEEVKAYPKELVPKIHVVHIEKAKLVFNQLREILGDVQILGVKDEESLHTSEYHYRKLAINTVNSIPFNYTLWLSATPNLPYNYTFAKLPVLGFESIHKTLRIKDVTYGNDCGNDHAKDEREALTLELRDELKKGDGVILVRLNSKQSAKKIAKLLRNNLKSNQIMFFNASKLKGNICPHKKYVHQNSAIPEGIRIVFATSALDVGINLNINNLQRIFYTVTNQDVWDNSVLEQFVNRPRNITQLPVTLVYPARLQQRQGFGGNVKHYYQFWEKECRNEKVRLENEIARMASRTAKNSFLNEEMKGDSILKNNADILKNYSFINRQDNTYFIDSRKVTTVLERSMKYLINVQDFKALLAEKFTIITEKVEDKSDVMLQTQIKEVRKMERKEKKKVIQHIAKSCANIEFFYALHQQTNATNLKKNIHEAFGNSLTDTSLEEVLGFDSEEIEAYEEHIHTVAHRYFKLLEFGLKEDDIISQLSRKTSQKAFSTLIKKLSTALDVETLKWDNHQRREIAGNDERHLARLEVIENLKYLIEHKAKTQQFSELEIQNIQNEVKYYEVEIKAIQAQINLLKNQIKEECQSDEVSQYLDAKNYKVRRQLAKIWRRRRRDNKKINQQIQKLDWKIESLQESKVKTQNQFTYRKLEWEAIRKTLTQLRRGEHSSPQRDKRMMEALYYCSYSEDGKYIFLHDERSLEQLLEDENISQISLNGQLTVFQP